MIADGRNRLLAVGVNSDVLSCWQACYEQFKEQPRELVSELQYCGSVDDKCQAVFGYMCDHVYYLLDKAGDQYIKSPARLLKDGCGDCKSLTMFLVCCLHGLGISHKMRFVSFDGSDIYGHVYAVALDERGEEIILDACETDPEGKSIYDYARPYKKKKDIVYYEQ